MWALSTDYTIRYCRQKLQIAWDVNYTVWTHRCGSALCAFAILEQSKNLETAWSTTQPVFETFLRFFQIKNSFLRLKKLCQKVVNKSLAVSLQNKITTSLNCKNNCHLQNLQHSFFICHSVYKPGREGVYIEIYRPYILKQSGLHTSIIKFRSDCGLENYAHALLR